MTYLPPKAIFPQTPHHLIHNLPCSVLLQEPPINFPYNVLATSAAAVKSDHAVRAS